MGVVVVLVLAWAFWPINEQPIVVHRVDSERATLSSADGTDQRDTLSTEAFAVTLWYIPEPTLRPNVSVNRSPKITFELLAISSVTDADNKPVMQSVVYDPKDDTILTLRVGDEVHGYTVSVIEQTGVTLVAGRATMLLTLDDGGTG